MDQLELCAIIARISMSMDGQSFKVRPWFEWLTWLLLAANVECGVDRNE
jgi:hypothetical protein